MRKYSIVPVVTPFFKGSPDIKLLKRHIDNLLKKGVDKIFLFGSTGLGPSLTMQEKTFILNSFVEYGDYLIPQVGSLNLSDSIELTKLAKKNMCWAVASFSPYYYPRMPDSWVQRYFSKISSIHDTMIYNIPAATGYNISSSMITDLVKSGAKIIGVKDTIQDFTHMLELRSSLPNEVLVLCGPDLLSLSALRSGLDGIVAGSGNYIPDTIVELKKKYETAEGFRLQIKINVLTSLARKYGQYSANYDMVSIIQRYSVGQPRPPIFPLTNSQHRILEEEIHRLDI